MSTIELQTPPRDGRPAIARIMAAGLVLATLGCSSRPAADDPAAREVASEPIARKADDQSPARASDPQPTGPEAADTAERPGGASADAEVPAPDRAPDRQPSQAELAREIQTRLAKLTSADEQERLEAIRSLDQIGDPAINQASQLLDSGPVEQQLACAAYLVGRVGARHTEAIPAVVKVLNSENPTLRHRAFHTLERLPAPALQGAAEALAAMLQNRTEQSVYRVRAARVLARLPDPEQPIVAVLERVALDDPDSFVRRAAFAAMTEAAPPETGEAFFVKALAHARSKELRRLAAKWLGDVARTDDGVRGLIVGLNDSEADVRQQASASLVAIGRPAVPMLVEAMAASAPRQQRRYAIYTLGKLGPLAGDATSALEQQLQDPDDEIRALAQAALKLVKRP